MIIEVNQGKLKGLVAISALTGKEYYSFLGIPYARPPIGDLRFQEPRPPEKWNGVLEAKDDRKICVQIKQLNEGQYEFEGGEDCLYLNVHTADPKPQQYKAVMVFLHGGAFLTGSGSIDIYSPDYLINYDIVLITLNYRLHVFGFLNLGIPECRGNFGLKDQLMALQWINTNIRQFGGDPENVTLFGESAGASSVHWHMISPLSRSKGFFQKAIAQSGTAYNSWAFVQNARDKAFSLGSILGFRGDDPLELFSYLKELPAEKLTAAVFDLYFDGMNHIGEHEPFSFVPSIEVVKEDAFVPDAPANLIKNTKPLPLIAGMNDKEGLIVMGLVTKNLLRRYRDDFTIFFRHRFDSSVLTRRQMSCIATKVIEHYFDSQLEDESEDDSAERLINIDASLRSAGCWSFEATWGKFRFRNDTIYKPRQAFSDLMCLQFYDSFERVADPLYVYEFAFDGEHNVFKSMYLRNIQPIKGASHADELGYLFYQRRAELLVAQPSKKFQFRDTKVIENMCSLWSDFAKTGNPTPDTKGNFEWRPSTTEVPRYLRINEELKMIDGKIMDEGRVFWQNLIEEARSMEK